MRAGYGSFSPITDRDFAFTSVTHTCRVSIDEEGCEAASVMIAPVSGASAPPEEELDFRLDRPFLFMVIWGSSRRRAAGALDPPACRCLRTGALSRLLFRR